MWRQVLTTFLVNRTSLFGAVLATALILIAVGAPWISPYDPLGQNVYHRLTAPEAVHAFGTDEYGRDVLSRVLLGMRVSFLVGVVSVALAMIFGTTLGMFAAYVGGKTEGSVMRGLDILLSFPDEVFGVMVMVVLGPGVPNVILAITVLLVPRFARLAHAPTLALKAVDYVTSARSLGAGDVRILGLHILPNMLGETIVMGTLWLGTAIRLEASLSFLGVGVPPPTPTLGNMVRTGVDFLGIAPWVSVFPGLGIMVAVLAFNLLGDGMRDITDPKLYDR